MKFTKKHFKSVALIFVIGFVIYMSMNFKEVERVWTKWLKGEAQGYHGNINIWHINDEFSVKIPYSSMLKKYEKQNFGIFVNVEYLSPDELAKKAEQGEQPDIVSYSKVPDMLKQQFTALEKTDTPFIKAGMEEKKLKAYPLCYDTYSLIINEEITDELEEEIPSALEPDYILTKLAKLNYPEEIVPLGFSSWGGAVNLLLAAERGSDIAYNQATLKDFADGKVAAMVCSTLELDKYSGELPAYSAVQLGGFTDRVRFVSVCEESGDKNRIKCSKEIAELLMTEKYQKQIAEYAFSAVILNESPAISREIVMPCVFENSLNAEEVIKRLGHDREKLADEIQKMME